MHKYFWLCMTLILVLLSAACGRGNNVPSSAEIPQITEGEIEAFLRGENKELMEKLNGK